MLRLESCRTRMQFAFFLIAVLLPIQATLGQITTGTIAGTVKDPSEAVLPRVTVTVKNVGTGITRSVVTDEQGRYRVPDLPVGSYDVRASQTGFKEFVRSGINLIVGQEALINILMQVGEVTEQVTVVGEAPLVDTTGAQVGGLVSSTQVRELPLNGRSFDQLALIQPGVRGFRQIQTTANTSFGTRMTVSGARLDANNLMMDGIEINDWARTGGGSAAGLFLGVDAVQEFKVLTHNYSAEFGRNSGAIINVVTRSGTNTFHGSAYEFLRNDNLDARNFFDKEKSALGRNQFGVYVSGPVIRDKAFFTANYEGFRERRGSPITNFVLSQDTRQGIVPTGRIAIDPAIVPFLSSSVMPLPNAGILTGGVTGRYVFQFTKPTQEDFGMGRLDYRLSDSNTFMFRYTIDKSNSRDRDFRGGGQPFFSTLQDFGSQNGVFAYTRLFGASVVNDFRAGIKRSTPQSSSFEDPRFPQNLSFVPGQPFGRMEFSTSANAFGVGAASALSAIGQASLTPGHWFQTGYQLNDHVLYTHGAHTVKLGADYELLRDWVLNTNVPSGGFYTFSSIPDFLSARPSQFQAPLPSQDITHDSFQHVFAWFVTEDFRAISRVTFNMGIRHEFVTSPRDRRAGYTADILDPRNDRDASVTPVYFNVSTANIAPRVGLAWDVFGDGKTSIRSGFGMYHNLWIGRDFGIKLQFAPQYRGTLTLQPPARQPVFPNEFLVQQALGFPLISSRPTGDNFQYNGIGTPTALHYSLEIQRELFSTGTIKVGYIGSHSYHLRTSDVVNWRRPTIQADGRLFFNPSSPLVNPNLNTITQVGSDATSRYNSLQMDFRMRPTRGLELQSNYVWSRSTDNLSSNAGADSRGAPTVFSNPFNHAVDKALSDFDARHNFTLNFLYDFPASDAKSVAGQLINGWSLGGILTLTTGNPFTPLVGFCRSNVTTNCGTDRPDLAPGASNNPIIGDPNHYFDATAFTLQAPGFFGNAGRNTMGGPGFATFDLSIYKKFRIGEGKALQFRTEMFNVLNRANFALPGANLFSSNGSRQENAGVIIGTVTTGREIQFGLRLSF